MKTNQIQQLINETYPLLEEERNKKDKGQENLFEFYRGYVYGLQELIEELKG